MNPEEALEILRKPELPDLSKGHIHTIGEPKRISMSEYMEARKMAIGALEKQVPKKVKNIRSSRIYELEQSNIMEGECPECGETSTGNYMGYYCGCCGVALDWGYEE